MAVAYSGHIGNAHSRASLSAWWTRTCLI